MLLDKQITDHDMGSNGKLGIVLIYMFFFNFSVVLDCLYLMKKGITAQVYYILNKISVVYVDPEFVLKTSKGARTLAKTLLKRG